MQTINYWLKAADNYLVKKLKTKVKKLKTKVKKLKTKVKRDIAKCFTFSAISTFSGGIISICSKSSSNRFSMFVNIWRVLKGKKL